MLVLKLVSTISAQKEYFEFPRITVGVGSWEKPTDDIFEGRAFIVTDAETIDENLCKPNIYIPDIFLDEPEEGEIVNIVIGKDTDGHILHTIAIADGGYEGYIMQDGKTIDRL